MEQRGLKAQGARGATTVPSAARPRQHVQSDGEQTRGIDSADTQARRVQKGQHAFHGCRGHAGVDGDLIQHKGAAGSPMPPLLKTTEVAGDGGP